jgi:flagellar biosynthesis protein FlhG
MITSQRIRSTRGRMNLPVPARSQSRRSTSVSGIAPVIAITSGKGGVGKTNIAANLALALTLMGQRVLAIDADVGLANLDLLFGVRPIYTLADFFSGKADLDEIIVRTTHDVLFLPGASGIQQLTALSGVQKLALASGLEGVSKKVDVVIVDTSSGISDAVTYFAAAAQEIVVVVTAEPASLTDAYALIKILAAHHGQKHFQVLANNVIDEKQATGLFNCLSRVALRFLNVSLSYLGWIPNDPALVAAVLQSRLVIEETASSPSAQAFRAVAGEVMAIAAAGIQLKGNLQFVFSR